MLSAREELRRLGSIFPDVESSPGDRPLAYGGDLSPETLLGAYARGIFPWSANPITWWSPDPRCVLPISNFHISSRSARKIRQSGFSCSLNNNFAEVMRQCAAERPGQEGTWINQDFISAYTGMHRLGLAWSVETWRQGVLVGGLYGLVLGRAFFGESMFHLEPEASRAALCALVEILRERDFLFIDCQQTTPHMLRMGAEPMPRRKYLALLDQALDCYEQRGEI